jgi:hypothetical protein
MRKLPIYAVLCIGWRLLFGRKSIAFSFRYLLFYGRKNYEFTEDELPAIPQGSEAGAGVLQLL